MAPDLDLTPDQIVSRPHARLWVAEGQHWIEDLSSRRGTQVNDEEIKGQGKRRLHAGDTIRIGDTNSAGGHRDGIGWTPTRRNPLMRRWRNSLETIARNVRRQCPCLRPYRRDDHANDAAARTLL